jgi:hypothetical protein
MIGSGFDHQKAGLHHSGDSHQYLEGGRYLIGSSVVGGAAWSLA